MDLELLLANADDGRPTLEGGPPLESAANEPDPEADRPPGASSFYDFAEDPNDITLQRWGIIAPEGPEGDRLLEIVEPLRRQREADQNGAPVYIFRAPSGMDTRAAWKWKDTEYRKEGVPTEDLPRYLLALGDIDKLSLSLQQVLGSDLLLGRLVCQTDDGYDAYVKKVLQWEHAPPATEDPRALFFTVKDTTAATTIGHKALVKPSINKADERRQKGKFHARTVEEIPYDGPDDSKSAFLEQMAGAGASMLFTMSHGLGSPRGGWKSRDEQLAMQGALSFGSGVKLTAEEVASVPFLPGGIWFLLACYGGGTPARSAYHDWLVRLRDSGGFRGKPEGVLNGLPKEGEAPFIAALPKAVLANPRGPLSVMAHLDLAWTYSFQDLGVTTQDRSSRFEDIFRTLVAGKRSGVSHNQLLRFMGETSIHLTSIYEEEATLETQGAQTSITPDRVREKANLWMLRQDLAGYILLGDPATRLPVKRNAPPQVDPVPEVKRAPTVASPAQTQQSASSAGPGPATAPADFSGALEQEQEATSPAQAAFPAYASSLIEDAVVEALAAQQKAEREVAERYSVPREKLRQWIDAYQAGGRKAISGLR